MPRVLHEVSRAARRTGRRDFAGIHWFNAGAAALLASQKPNGSWQGPAGSDVATAHAVMFLSAMDAPVVFHHFRHGGDWNNWPRGLEGLTWWIGRQFSTSITWGVVDTETPHATLREAPVLLVTGAEAPRFTPMELAHLRTYVLAGGLIWSIAEGPAFDEAMRDVYRKVLPQRELAPCPPRHLLRDRYFKLRTGPQMSIVSNGVRVLAVHAPPGPLKLTRAWHLRNSATQRAAFETAANVMFYAIDMWASPVCPSWPTAFKGKPKRTVTLARLKYKGNYDPEPLAYERFKRMMGHDDATQVNVVAPVEIGKLAATGAKLAVLTGTEAITLAPAEQQALKRFVTAGGTLFIDAAGGDPRGKSSNGVADSVAKMLETMFSKQKLLRLNIDSPIYTVSPALITRVSWRRSTMIRLAGLKAPRLQAITLDGRPAVIFSRLDVTAGLLGAPAAGIHGYHPRSAYEIMRNIVLYVAKGQADANKAK